MHAAGGRDRASQRSQRAPAAAGAPARCQVELDIRGAACGNDRIERGPRERRPAQVGVHHDAGGIDDGPQAGRGGGKCGDGVLGDALGLDLSGARPLLGVGDHGLHQCAAQHPLRFDQARIGEQDVGAGHPSPRISRLTHVTQSGPKGHGGGGRESNPPAAVSAVRRF